MGGTAPMSIIAFDPGMTTGVAIKDNNGDYHTLAIPRTEYHEIHGFITEHPWEWISVEQFQTSNIISRYGLRTTELVGAIECMCWLMKVQCFRRTAQARLPRMHVAREMLQAKNVSYVDHQLDALAQLLSVESDIKRGKLKVDTR